MWTETEEVIWRLNFTRVNDEGKSMLRTTQSAKSSTWRCAQNIWAQNWMKIHYECVGFIATKKNQKKRKKSSVAHLTSFSAAHCSLLADKSKRLRRRAHMEFQNESEPSWPLTSLFAHSHSLHRRRIMFSDGARVALSEWKTNFNLPKIIWNILLLLWFCFSTSFFLSLSLSQCKCNNKILIFVVRLITNCPLTTSSSSQWRKNDKEIERPNTMEKTYRNSSCLILMERQSTDQSHQW